MCELSEAMYEQVTSTGRQFINYFKQIYKLSPIDKGFNTITANMQDCYDSIKNIHLNRSSNYPIDNKQLVVWFFTDGSSLSLIFDDEYEAHIYDEFMIELLSNNRNNRVVDVLSKLLSNN